MPHPQIDRKQRDALFNLILLELSHMDDLAISVEGGDEAKAKQHRQQLEDYFRLLDDLGWKLPTEQQTFKLTQDQSSLSRVLQALGQRATKELQLDTEELRATIDQRDEDATLVISTTIDLLAYNKVVGLGARKDA